MRRFTISTDRIGPRRWCWVRIHPSVEELRAFAHRLSPHRGRSWWDDCCGCFQPTPVNIDAATGEYLGPPANGYAGTLRLAEGWVTSEIVAHELMHAACTVYRLNVHADIRLGNGCRTHEEELACIYGELYADMEAKLHEEAE